MEKKNKWKIAFWWSTIISVLLLLFVICFSIYTIIDQGYTITYGRDSWDWENEDKNNLITIINNTNFSKNEIIKELKIKDYMIENDTIHLFTIKLIFENDTLQKIKNEFENL